nr:DUF5915 domain-containing protein [Aeropyrum camini]
MEDLRIHDAARALRSFIIEDVSHWYLRIIRRRVWEEVDTPSKRAAYATLYKVLWEWLLMAAPFIPYTAEYLYIKVFREAEERPEESIHMLDMPEPEDHLVDSALEEDMEKARMVIEAILSARNEAGLKLRRPVRRVIIAASSQEAERSLRRLEGLIRLMANAKEIEFAPASALEATRIYRVEPDYGRLGPRFKREMPKVLRLIEERGGEIGRLLAEKGVYEAEYEGLRIRLTLEDVSLKAEYPEWLKVRDTPLGLVAVDTRLTREEVLEGVARDIVRRIQAMRKEAGYNVEDYVEVWIEGSGDVEEAVNALKDYIKRETRAVRLELGTPPSGVEVLREWELDGDRVVIGLRRAAASG